MTLFGVFSCVRGQIDNDIQNQNDNDNDIQFQKPDDNDNHSQFFPLQ